MIKDSKQKRVPLKSDLIRAFNGRTPVELDKETSKHLQLPEKQNLRRQIFLTTLNFCFVKTETMHFVNQQYRMLELLLDVYKLLEYNFY